MDEGSAKAVRVAFERLYRADLAYRTEALVNWCPGCRTSVSDLEVDRHAGDRDALVGALPPDRPGDRPAVAGRDHHDRDDPARDDPRRHRGRGPPGRPALPALVGRLVRIPFVDRDVPIIADAVVDPAFGTGAVKITPAHDHDDHETGLRHGLPAPTILADDGTITATGTRYDGMDRFDARAAIVADLEAAGDLVAAAPHEMVIGRCQRSNDIIEPRLKTQWFIRTTPLAERALEATRSGRTRILPERFEKTWEHWLTDIRDWNVSRQLWWGHRIPAWYCPDGHVTVSSEEAGPDACAVCGRPAADLQQDPDIFDTWFSSGLWPFSTLGWPDDTPDYRTYYPTSVMETGYDIIFFWVARMMMLGLQLTDREPFHTVYLSGLIRDPLGQKMSKTKGNVVDPLGVIDEAGADALRFALIHGATPGNDQRFGPAKLEHARNFANKLWNATRYVAGARPASIPEGAERRLPDERHLGPAERWLLSRAAATTEAVDAAMAGYAFGEVTRLVYEAIWNEYCDWGLEFAKVRLADERLSQDEREATWWTLVEVLDTYLRLLHPVMPFVTEALWAALPHRASDPDLLIVARWPGVGKADPLAERDVAVLIDLVGEIRNARASAKLPAADWLETLVYVPIELGPTFEGLRPAIERLARARPLRRELTPEALEAAARTRRPHGAGRRRRDRGGRPTEDDRRRRRRLGTRTPRSATWPRPRDGWRPPASDSRTRRSSAARRPRWSRLPGRARPNWPTRSTSSGTASSADPRPGSGHARGATSNVATTGRWSDASPAARWTPHEVARRPRVSRWSIRSVPQDARRGSPTGMPTVVNASSNEPANGPHLGRLDRRVEVAGHDDRRSHALGGGRHGLDLGTSLLVPA